MDGVDVCFVNVLAKVLERLIDANEWWEPPAHVMTKFQSSYVPDVSILSYLERIRRYAKCSDCVFVAALIYIDRIIVLKQLILSRLNIHRLLISSVLIAAKFLDDLFYNNAFYARLGGISVCEMNSLELEFLQLIGFSLHVTPDNFEFYRNELTAFTTIPRPFPVRMDSNSRIDESQSPFVCFGGNILPSKVHVDQAASFQRVKVARVDCSGFAEYHRVLSSIPTNTSSDASGLGFHRVVSNADCTFSVEQTPPRSPFNPRGSTKFAELEPRQRENLRSIFGTARNVGAVTPPFDDFATAVSAPTDSCCTRAFIQAQASFAFPVMAHIESSPCCLSVVDQRRFDVSATRSNYYHHGLDAGINSLHGMSLHDEICRQMSNPRHFRCGNQQSCMPHVITQDHPFLSHISSA